MRDFAERGLQAVKEKEKYYPTLTIKEDVLPSMEKYKVGDKFMMIMECKLCGISSYANQGLEYRLEVRKGELKNKEKKEL